MPLFCGQRSHVDSVMVQLSTCRNKIRLHARRTRVFTHTHTHTRLRSQLARILKTMSAAMWSGMLIIELQYLGTAPKDRQSRRQGHQHWHASEPVCAEAGCACCLNTRVAGQNGRELTAACEPPANACTAR